MNLYLLKRTTDCDYNQYDSLVVVANNEDQAKSIHPDNSDKFSYLNPNTNKPNSIWVSKDCIQVTYLGKADDSLELGQIICSSFNAG